MAFMNLALTTNMDVRPTKFVSLISHCNLNTLVIGAQFASGYLRKSHSSSTNVEPNEVLDSLGQVHLSQSLTPLSSYKSND